MAQIQGDPMQASEPKNAPRLTVLVVDDSAPERSLLKAMFHQQGHRVVEAANGAEALLALTSEHPDVVVSDGVMPILDGYQFCRLLKDAPATRQIPVILLTGQAGGLSRFWARTCGAECFLLKGRDTARVVETALELTEQVGPLSTPGQGTPFDAEELGIEAIHQRLGKALEHQLLESAMRDTIGHLYTLHRDALEMTDAVLDLLHELVLPGAIHLVIQNQQGPMGIGLHGNAVGAEARRTLEEAAHRSLGQEAPWPSTWREKLPLKEEAAELHDPVLFSLPVGMPACPVTAWMTLYLEHHAFQQHERLFEVACQELGRLLDLAENRRQLLQTEEALRQAKKAESLALMAGAIAHDFNNLFQSIMGSLQVAELSPTDERGKLALARAMTAVQKGAGLGRRMLESSGHMWCVTAPLDLNALVREVVGAHPHLTILLALAPELPPMLGDRNQIKQVLAHLLENAVDALGSGPGTLTVATHLSDDGQREGSPEGRWFTEAPKGRTLGLTVTDEGCGIPEEVMDRMFDPFFSTKQMGRGMGLSASRGILKAHQAALQVVSRVGEGTTFHLWFPLAKSPQAS
jgi:signal transduction histidine kinase/ActR/RegA family two-component response regulator